MAGQDLDLRTKWNQLGSAIGALLNRRGIRVSPNELDRLANRVHVCTSAIEIDVAATPGSDSMVNVAVQYMQQAAECRSTLTNDGASTYQAIYDLIDQCEVTAKAKENGEQRLDQGRLDGDGGRSATAEER